MGYMKHHAIVVTGWERDQVDAARGKAVQLDMTITPVIESPVNSHWSFMIAPDGSKEGWGASGEGDQQRNAFVEWLEEPSVGVFPAFRKRYALDWAEVVVGDENGPSRVTRSNRMEDE